MEQIIYSAITWVDEKNILGEEYVNWLAKEKFMELRLYETKTYFGRYNGWMAIDDANDLIYVHTYTQ